MKSLRSLFVYLAATALLVSGVWAQSVLPSSSALPDPAISYNFVRDTYYQPAAIGCTTVDTCLTTVRASVGYADSTDGTWTQFASNVARRTNKGLLAEEARTNSIRNNSMQGAVAGVIGSGGALPSNWSLVGGTGLTFTVSNITTTNGVDTFDLRMAGTTGGTFTNINFDTTTGIAATNGQTWSLSAFLSLAAGTKTNITSVFEAIRMDNAGGTFLAQLSGNNLISVLTSSFIHPAFAGTLNNASTAFIQPTLSFAYSNGVAVDLTIRFGWPQIELGAFATSPIRTTSATVTRAADVVTVKTVPAFGSAFSLFAEAMPNVPVSNTTNQQYLNVDDGTPNERANVYRNAASGTATGATQLVHGGVVTEFSQGITWQTSASGKIAGAFETNNNSGAFNGSLNTPTILTEVIPTGLTTVHIGTRYDGAGAFANAYIQRIAIWPITRLSNSVLQRLTAP